jgi:tetratricopeptide (TPR) repeat protein
MVKNSKITEWEDAEKVNMALQAIKQNDFSTAWNFLEEVVANTPEKYECSYEEGGTLFVRCWNLHDFMEFVAGLNKNQRERDIEWIPSVYPRAYYYLGYLDLAKRKYESALTHLEASLKLEPNQLVCLCEVGCAYQEMGDHEKAVLFLDRALKSRRCINPKFRAKALRVKGIELIKLGELDSAKKCLIESLSYEPNNQLALRKMEYLSKLKCGRTSVEEAA